DHGAALVLHSAAKYIGGHGDTRGGVIATNSEWATRLRRVRAVTGALQHPPGPHLLHRGLRPLPVRLRAAHAPPRRPAPRPPAQRAISLAGCGPDRRSRRCVTPVWPEAIPAGSSVGRWTAEVR